MKNFMMTIALALTFIAAPLISSPSMANESNDVDAAFSKWRNALSGGSAQAVVDLYDDDAVLLATLADKPITNQKDRTAYFETLTVKPKLKATVNEKFIRILDEDDAVISGIYTFSFQEGDKVIEIPARYTFVYEKENNVWKIVEHHSSKLPSAK